jgi:hypothetical protein
MENLDLDKFQKTVSEYLVRHKSILDVLSKNQEVISRVNRSVVKAVTNCGCVKIDASKQVYPDSVEFSELKDYLSTHFQGTLCKECRDAIENDVGRSLFYLAALCNLLDLDMQSIVDREYNRITALGMFNLT